MGRHWGLFAVHTHSASLSLTAIKRSVRLLFVLCLAQA